MRSDDGMDGPPWVLDEAVEEEATWLEKLRRDRCESRGRRGPVELRLRPCIEKRGTSGGLAALSRGTPSCCSVLTRCNSCEVVDLLLENGKGPRDGAGRSRDGWLCCNCSESSSGTDGSCISSGEPWVECARKDKAVSH